MVNVVPQDADVESGHAVVLAGTFESAGETWFEVIDSNQSANRRLYLSATELATILQENGVAFRSEPGSTPKLLR